MRSALKTIYSAAKHPHLSAADLRIAIVKAVERRGHGESFETAFKRHVTEAIFAYEREHLAK